MRYWSILLLLVTLLFVPVQAQDDTITPFFDNIVRVSWSPDGQMLAIQSTDLDDAYMVFVEIWDSATNEKIGRLEADLFAIRDFTWSPDSSMIAVYGWRTNAWGTERTVDIFFVDSASEEFRQFENGDIYPTYRHFDGIEYDPLAEDGFFPIEITWSPDSTKFAASFVDGIRVYQVGDEEPISVMPLTNVTSLNWQPNGNQLAVFLGNTVEILELP